jgi:DNA-binding IclR family transcriptional regulator
MVHAGDLGDSGGVAAVDRALSILDVFTEEYVSLAEIARRTGLYKSTAARLINSLEKFGYVLRLADGNFRLGAKAFKLGALYQRYFSSSEVVLPILRQLVAELQEDASFYVQDGGKRICLHRVNGTRAVGQLIHAGDPLPLTVGAAGHVLRAFNGGPGKKLDEIRRVMYAATAGERDPELAAIATPVFGMNDKLIGALSVSGPRYRLEELGVERVLPILFKHARTLTRSFGGHSDPAVDSVRRTAAGGASGAPRTAGVDADDAPPPGTRKTAKRAWQFPP